MRCICLGSGGGKLRAICAILVVRMRIAQAPRADDSLWIRVWPETATASTTVSPPPPPAGVLVALASRPSIGTCLAVQQQCFEVGSSQGNAEIGIHDAVRALAHLCVSAFVRRFFDLTDTKENLVYSYA